MNKLRHERNNNKLYRTWLNMKRRCDNKRSQKYKYYGGRGIKVCKEWLHDFQAFHDWAMNNCYDDNLTLDRINVDSDYEPNNCRWVDQKTQVRNTTRNVYYTIDGKRHCLSEWCELLGLNYKTVWQRINKLGWTVEKALELKCKS